MKGKLKAHVARRVRELNAEGEILVNLGDTVKPDSPVGQAHIPGTTHVMNLVSLLDCDADAAAAATTVQVGDVVRKGDILAQAGGIFGKLDIKVRAPAAGRIESISRRTGQLLVSELPDKIPVLSHLPGKIVDVKPGRSVTVETHATVCRAVFGVGATCHGRLELAPCPTSDPLDKNAIRKSFRNCIVAGGSRATLDALREASTVGVQALITGGIHLDDLNCWLDEPHPVAVSGSESSPISLVIVGGFGDISFPETLMNRLKPYFGSTIYLSPRTQIRSGAIRPEIIIPLASGERHDLQESEGAARRVMLTGPSRIGLRGRLTGTVDEYRTLQTGARSRVCFVDTETEGTLMVPVTNVELMD